ncbi:outer membrane protein [Bradyrhizobium neotropicale]|uniref:outer membrane protein n=1 Tax=Bradyrhizobium neotropicale TaxID=1497615 RepID=UPI001AD6F211|nr:outer membrane beta-barrel protein [Bradyrhizobium neotropicale]MBO4226638.1 outer membrane beta-barrel protein [Bradyrhizobium neotropicale]
MFSYTKRKARLFVVCLGFAALDCGTADAEPSSADLVLQKIAALEARIAALEVENRAYRREAENARSQAKVVMEKPSRKSYPESRAVASAMPYKAIEANRPASGWTGAYWGASAGGAATRSSVVSAQRDTQAISTNPLPFAISGLDTVGNSSANNGGGLIDLFAGWSVQVSKLVLGAQLEATASQLNFSSTGSKAYTYFNAAGPTGQAAVGDFRPQVAAQWMTSALLRAGVLLDDRTLIYGVGGWTGGEFEARNVTDNPFYQPVESFWVNGWTAGGGIERKLDSNWSVRAEYRYTDFGTRRTIDHFSFTGAPVVQTSDRQTQYSQSMQSGRIGFAYAFNPLQ